VRRPFCNKPRRPWGRRAAPLFFLHHSLLQCHRAASPPRRLLPSLPPVQPITKPPPSCFKRRHTRINKPACFDEGTEHTYSELRALARAGEMRNAISTSFLSRTQVWTVSTKFRESSARPSEKLRHPPHCVFHAVFRPAGLPPHLPPHFCKWQINQ